jgi:hypothetical protein
LTKCAKQQSRLRSGPLALTIPDKLLALADELIE